MSERELSVLQLMLEIVEKIQGFAKPFKTVKEFETDVKTFDACMMNFIVIGELVMKLSDNFLETHNGIEWYKIRAFRNFAAHDYFGIDAEKIWDIIQNKLPEFKRKLSVLTGK